MAVSDHLLSLLIPTLVLLHLFIAPYSKVEESFNLQAIHDLLRYGIPDPRSPHAAQTLKAEYDHLTFPGAVPRTFIGAVVVAGLSRPFITLLNGRVNEQVVVRGVLGLLNASALMYYGQAARKAFGRGVGNWYIILQAAQFHVLFYASRTLPNVFAFCLSTFALAHFLPIPGKRGRRLGIYLLTFSAIVFRSELSILLLTQLLHLFLSFPTEQSLHLIFIELLPAGLTGSLIGLFSTLSLDSYLWQTYPLNHPHRPFFSTPFLTEKWGLIWPEFTAFWYNAVKGNATAWGVNPWHTYFTNSIPKLIMNPYALFVLIPLALTIPALRPRAMALTVPSLAFASVYSLLAHKEWRFIMYIVPPLTLTAAMAAHWIWVRRGKSIVYMVMALALVGSVWVSFIAGIGMGIVSSQNYPGGEALVTLHTYLDGDIESWGRRNVTVHLDVPVCMTGATRFLQETPLYPAVARATMAGYVTFDKTEDEDTLRKSQFWDKMDWILSSVSPEKLPGGEDQWDIVDVVRGYKRLKLYRWGEETEKFGGLLGRSLRVLEGIVRNRLFRGRWVGIEREEKVWILRRRVGSREF